MLGAAGAFFAAALVPAGRLAGRGADARFAAAVVVLAAFFTGFTALTVLTAFTGLATGGFAGRTCFVGFGTDDVAGTDARRRPFTTWPSWAASRFRLVSSSVSRSKSHSASCERPRDV